ncbi:hypothetical protein BDW69DRAFT_7373 [Aspergillus filifer]
MKLVDFQDSPHPRSAPSKQADCRCWQSYTPLRTSAEKLFLLCGCFMVQIFFLMNDPDDGRHPDDQIMHVPAPGLQSWDRMLCVKVKISLINFRRRMVILGSP